MSALSYVSDDERAKVAADLAALKHEIVRFAQEKGNGGADDADSAEARQVNGSRRPIKSTDLLPPCPPEMVDRPPAFSDEALALCFAERHARNLRYVPVWSRWMVWTGSYWRVDETLCVFDRVRSICREAAAGCDKPSVATAIASGRTVAAVERLARSDRRIAATIDQWDSDPWLLNTSDGVIDLKTGALRPHRPEDYITKVTSAGPRGKCPRFLAFLDRITGADADLAGYVRRVLGYSLTGLTREHALFFAYGTGANGKSVLLSTVAGILGDYHKTAPLETFVASNGDRHPTDLAGLRGSRLVTASETEEGRRWAEARIKQLTGGDRVSARFMRQDFFEFLPQFKLIIAGNHKPSLRSVDEAIRRRFHLIPFSVTIPTDERDGELTEKLKEEWPGILAWLIEGCLEWQRTGLRPPQAVLEATEAYLSAEDSLAAWMDERCDRDPQAWSSLSALFASWSDRAVKAGEVAGSQKRFSQTLEARGFQLHKRNVGQGFYGLHIRLLGSDDEPWGDEK
jgi:putative DNA primase/helicase